MRHQFDESVKGGLIAGGSKINTFFKGLIEELVQPRRTPSHTVPC